MVSWRRWVLPGSTTIGYVVLAVVTARDAGAMDRATFRELNDDRRRRWLRIPQQAGTPWVLPGLAVVAWWRGERRLALAAAMSLPAEKGIEVATKKLSRRPRPARVEAGTRLRDDAPTDGPSYPSGHAAIAACAVTLAARWTGTSVAVPSALLALLTGATRVHQGAHFPGDVLGGLFLGVALGSALPDLVDSELPVRALF